MKNLLIISLISFAGYTATAQATHAVCKKAPNMPANAKLVFPKSAYTPLQDASCPPCYEYTTKRGLKVMECPYAWFKPEGTSTSAPVAVRTVTHNDNGTMEMQSQNTYGGNYPSVCERLPNMPADAKMVWPKSNYTPTGNPACPPCYEYTTKRGLQVMECPNLWFPAEGKE